MVETAIALLLLGAVLFLLAGSAKWTRQRAKDQLAWDMLAALNKSLAAYVQDQGGYPPGRADRQPHEAIAALLADGADRPIVCIGDFWRPLLEMMAAARPGAQELVALVSHHVDDVGGEEEEVVDVTPKGKAEDEE